MLFFSLFLIEIGGFILVGGRMKTNISNNIFASEAQFGTANNNMVVSDFSTLFVDQASATSDGKYQLRPNSPGSGKGSGATDIWPFGGPR